MAAVEHDYYELLGVARDADEATIKKAFRAVARELHPDVSDAPDADERFKEVIEAYEVLSSSERRELYDRYGREGLRTGGFMPTTFDLGDLSSLFSAFFGDDLLGGARRTRRGADVGAEVAIELGEAAQGVTKPISLAVAVVCDTCEGTGAEPGTTPVPCSTCGGQGRLQKVSRTAFGEFVRTQTCPRCAGAGTIVENAVRIVPRRRTEDRGANGRRPDSAGDPRRAADSTVWGGTRGRSWRPCGRRLRARPRAPRSAVRARRQRHLLVRRRVHDPCGARGRR